MDMIYICADFGHVLLIFFCIAWLMGAFLKGDEAGFASSLFIIRTSVATVRRSAWLQIRNAVREASLR